MSDQLTLREMRSLSVAELMKLGRDKLRRATEELLLLGSDHADRAQHYTLSLQAQAAAVHVAIRKLKDDLLVEMDSALADTRVDRFGRDHWNLLLYVETRCVDHRGQLDYRHLRCNPHTHAEEAHDGSKYWSDSTHSTRWKDGRRTVRGHDDWDCLEELRLAGFVTVRLDDNGCVLTDAGWAKAGELRRNRAEGISSW